MTIKTNLMKTAQMWLRYIPAKGRCVHRMMDGDRCRCPRGHEGSHINWHLGVFISE
jgi:hypothetical protein